MTGVLIVEDDVLMAEALVRLIGDLGRCTIAHDVQTALFWIAGAVLGYVDLRVALVDLKLQGSIEGGKRVLLSIPSKMQPIVVSGYDERDMRRRVQVPYASAVGSLYIQKPISDEDKAALLLAIKRAGEERAPG